MHAYKMTCVPSPYIQAHEQPCKNVIVTTLGKAIAYKLQRKLSQATGYGHVPCTAVKTHMMEEMAKLDSAIPGIHFI